STAQRFARHLGPNLRLEKAYEVRVTVTCVSTDCKPSPALLKRHLDRSRLAFAGEGCHFRRQALGLTVLDVQGHGVAPMVEINHNGTMPPPGGRSRATSWRSSRRGRCRRYSSDRSGCNPRPVRVRDAT